VRPTAQPTRASIGVAAAAWFIGLAGSVVAYQLVMAATGHGGESVADVPFSVTAASVTAQWIPIVGMLWYVSNKFMTGSFVRDFGFRFKWIDLLGLPIGALAQLVVLELLYWPLHSVFEKTFSRHELERPARELTDRAGGGWKIVLVLLVVVGAPLVEETLYRGLLLRSLDARLADVLALLISAAWFAMAHFQPVQFVGLFAFGIILGSALQRTGRLGMGICAHAAFNATSLALLWSR
jgi:hypothetical protein